MRRTIVVVDLVESVRLMERDERRVIEYWQGFVAAARGEILPRHRGQMVKSLGDGMLLSFERAADGAAAAHALHAWTRERPLASGEPMLLRIGIAVADVVEDAIDVYGSGVNLAARVAAMAAPGGTWMTLETQEELIPGVDADIDDLGEIYLKHLSIPVHCYACAPPGTGGSPGIAPRVDDDLRPRLAVVPFTSRGDGDPRGVLGDLVVEEIMTLLSRCSEWRLISRLSSAAGAPRAAADPRPIASALGVDFLCTGSYRAQGDRVGVQMQLTRWPGGEMVWGTHGQASLADLLAGQSDLVLRLGSEIAEAVLGRGLAAVDSTPLPQLQSHELMLGAMVLMHRTRRAEFARALDVLDVLEARHPRAAQPGAWRAKWHVLRVVQGWADDPAQEGRLALQAARRAIAADGRSSLALAMQGLVQAYLYNDFAAARDSYDEALTHNPHEALALLLRGTMHAFMGEGAPAYAQTQQALVLSPLDPLRYFYLSLSASAAVADQRYDEAIGLAEASLRLNRLHLSTYRALAMAQSLAGQQAASARTVGQLLRLDPGYSVRRFRERFPGRDVAPEFTARLSDALASAGLPA